MCTQVQIDGILCSTPRQLAARLRPERLGAERLLEWVDHHGEMDWCLCVIDVPRTLERSALKWARQGASEMFVVER
ncbi:hypothetical protein [Mesorhizobium sp. B2-7-1]|uniref:hypothetical protein n=1 Tax=Mesorhizobium sp. B2-7-1 TaxID=2589909 RepID=UPI001126EB5A|nr:hypothetical protein [Mesorhizobium sp. B2-7-1]TPJ57993.1 hypothetical protein FJ471_21060 [Mesorhizobium sp. B2-7-1]